MNFELPFNVDDTAVINRQVNRSSQRKPRACTTCPQRNSDNRGSAARHKYRRFISSWLAPWVWAWLSVWAWLPASSRRPWPLVQRACEAPPCRPQPPCRRRLSPPCRALHRSSSSRRAGGVKRSTVAAAYSSLLVIGAIPDRKPLASCPPHNLCTPCSCASSSQLAHTCSQPPSNQTAALHQARAPHLSWPRRRRPPCLLPPGRHRFHRRRLPPVRPGLCQRMRSACPPCTEIVALTRKNEVSVGYVSTKEKRVSSLHRAEGAAKQWKGGTTGRHGRTGMAGHCSSTSSACSLPPSMQHSGTARHCTAQSRQAAPHSTAQRTAAAQTR